MSARERAEAQLVPTGVVTACCGSHLPVGCCDPEDCGPCCAECPTCPTVGRDRIIRVVTAEYDATGCPRCAVSSLALKPAVPDLVLRHVCGGQLVQFVPRSGARVAVG